MIRDLKFQGDKTGVRGVQARILETAGQLADVDKSNIPNNLNIKCEQIDILYVGSGSI